MIQTQSQQIEQEVLFGIEREDKKLTTLDKKEIQSALNCIEAEKSFNEKVREMARKNEVQLVLTDKGNPLKGEQISRERYNEILSSGNLDLLHRVHFKEINSTLVTQPNAYTGPNPDGEMALKTYSEFNSAQICALHGSTASIDRVPRLSENTAVSSATNVPVFVPPSPMGANSLQAISDTMDFRVSKLGFIQQRKGISGNAILGWWKEYQNSKVNQLTDYSYELPETFQSYILKNQMNIYQDWLETALWLSSTAFNPNTSGFVSPSTYNYPSNWGDGQYAISSMYFFPGLLETILLASTTTGSFVDPYGASKVLPSLGAGGLTVSTIKAQLDLAISSTRLGLRTKDERGRKGTKLLKFIMSADVYEIYTSALNAPTNFNGISQIDAAQYKYRGYDIIVANGLPVQTFLLASASKDTQESAFHIFFNTLSLDGTGVDAPVIVNRFANHQTGLYFICTFGFAPQISKPDEIVLYTATATVPSAALPLIASPFDTNLNYTPQGW